MQPKTTTTEDPMLALALSYSQQGWPVFPCRPADEFDPETGEVLPEKAPLISNGFRGATTNERVIRELWKRNPGALVGIPTGERTNVWVLDLDVKTNANGHEWLEAMEDAHGDLPHSARVQTANGGTHIFFRHVEGVRNRGKLGAGVDVRGEGGFVISGGSIMQDGRAYHWLDDTGPDDVVDAPDWLLRLVLPPVHEHHAGDWQYQSGSNDRYVKRAVEAELSELACTPPGNRGYQLNASAFALGTLVGSGALDRSEAEHGLYSAAVTCGVAQADGERETWAKIRRGLDAGEKQPRHIPVPEVPSNDNTRLVDISRMIENGLRKAERAKQAASQDYTQERIKSEYTDERIAANEPANHADESALKAEKRIQTSDSESANINPQPDSADAEISPEIESPPPSHSDLIIADWPSSRFVGEPEPVEWLVDGVIERGIPSMLAAMGEVGKSYSMLELCRRVAFGQKRTKFAKDNIFGGEVVAEGTAVFITGEDDARSIHRRLAALDPKGARFAEKGDKLLVIPLPSAVGAVKPFWRDDRKKGPVETDEWLRLVEQLLAIDDLVFLGFDPLQLFAALQINEDPAAGQFVCGSIATLAAHTGTNVMFTHHMAKRAKDILTPADARDAVRGSSALVDGVRLAYGLWYPPVETARKICKELGEKYEPNKIVMGSVIKANGPSSRTVTTYCRNEFGLLVDVTTKKKMNEVPEDNLLDALVHAVARAAKGGAPFSKTGASGLWEHRERLNDDLRSVSRHRLESLCQRALDSGRIVKSLGKSGTVSKWLDVPTGPFAMGLGEFRAGMARPC